jgi:hypothetical protein
MTVWGLNGIAKLGVLANQTNIAALKIPLNLHIGGSPTLSNTVPTNIRLEEIGPRKNRGPQLTVLRLIANTLSHSDMITKPVNPLRDHYSAASVIGVSASPVMTTPTISTPMVAVADRNANVLGVCNSDAAG